MPKSQKYSLRKVESGQDNKAFTVDFVEPIPRGAAFTNGKTNNGALVSQPKDEPKAEVWGRPIEFLLSCISMSVGLGNVWRFPFVAYENGGGAFLIPYFIVLFCIGSPMYFLEMAIGQFSSSGQVKVWRMVPFFKGIGYGSMIGTACVVSYYCSIMAITVFYFFASFQTTLPWTVCDESWGEEVKCFENGTVAEYNGTRKPIPELYFELEVIKKKANIDDGVGYPDWRLTLCLLFSWLVILGSLVKGVKSSGKVAYFTAIFPYIVLFILLVRGLTLEGSSTGISLLFKPDFEKILSAKVWYAAIGQCFFSLSTAFGPIIMYSSYNPFKHNFARDAFIISITDTLTSVIASATIFAIIGNLSYTSGQDIKTFLSRGTGLAFVSYPLAISKFDYVPQLFAVLFFLMMFTLGVGSATSLAGGIIRVFADQFPKINKTLITFIICILGFLSGIIYVTPGGQHILDLVDFFGATFVIYVFAILELVGIAWIYGVSNICRDVEFMLNKSFGLFWIYWQICWGFIIPVIMTFILIYALMFEWKSPDVPTPVLAVGWIITIFALLCFPIFGLHAMFSRKSHSLKSKFWESFKPTSDWGPKDPQLMEEWRSFKIKGTIERLKNLISIR